jgi:hypothetical protein
MNAVNLSTMTAIPTQPLHDGDAHDQPGSPHAATVRHVVRDATPIVDADSESRYEAKVKKRQTSTVDVFETRLITTEQRPRGNFPKTASRVDPAQLQIVQQPTTDFIFHGSCGHTAIAPGTHGSTSCTMDARRRPIADTLVCAPGKSASTRAIRRVPADIADSITSRMSPQLVRYEETSPASIPSRYARDLSQAQPIYNNANGVDLHQANSIVPVPSVPQFPSRLVREYDRQNHTTPLQDHDRTLDMSRSMRPPTSRTSTA